MDNNKDWTTELLPRELKQYSNRKLFIALGAMIAVALIATTATLIALSALTTVRLAAQTNNTARGQLQELLRELRTAESSNRGYLITDDREYLARYDQAVKDARTTLGKLKDQARNTTYKAEIDQFGPVIDEKFKVLDNTVRLTEDGGPVESIAKNLEHSRGLMDRIETSAASIESVQTALLVRDRASVQTLADVARDISVLTLVLTLVLAATVYYLYLKAIQSERQLDLAKDEFVSLASHQLRTPATGIKAILATLDSGDFGTLNERQSYFLKRAIDSNERELRIIEELLNVAKADAGRLVLHATEFELSGLIDTIASEQTSLISKKNQKLTIRCPHQPLTVYADEEKLYMAIGNLLDNARKYTPENGKISINVFSRHGEVFIEVADNGIGIEAEQLDHIFDRFQRAGSHALEGTVEGSGLGLYLAQRIAELQGGTIQVTSKLGKGTKFVMILPQGDYGAAAKGSAS
jgi:signal transduction histidine kinase